MFGKKGLATHVVVYDVCVFLVKKTDNVADFICAQRKEYFSMMTDVGMMLLFSFHELTCWQLDIWTMKGTRGKFLRSVSFFFVAHQDSFFLKTRG